MTCEDCIHFNDCLIEQITRYYGKEIACNDVEQRCKYFKDKSRFVELQDECIIDYDQNKWLLLNLESRDLGEGIKRILDYAIKQS